MARLEEIRRANLRLGRPARAVGGRGASASSARGQTIVALNHGIHSTEVAAPQTAIETASLLASRRATRGVARDPRPDRDADAAVAQPGRHAEGDASGTGARSARRARATTPPFLYQKYVGHDNNRDWYMFTQQESRLTAAHLYDRWRPQIVHDVHQMGTRGARLFVPPYVDPWEPNVDPALRRRRERARARTWPRGSPARARRASWSTRSTTRGRPRAPIRTRTAAVRLLSESASARLASPVDVPFADLQRRHRVRPEAALVELPRSVAGRAVAAARHRGLPGRATTRVAARARRAATARYWLRTLPGGEPARGRGARARSRSCCRRGRRTRWRRPRCWRVLRTGAVELHRARRRLHGGRPRLRRRRPRGPDGAAVRRLREDAARAPARTRTSAPSRARRRSGPTTSPRTRCRCCWASRRWRSRTPFEAAPRPGHGRGRRAGRVDGPRAVPRASATSTGELVALGRLLTAGIAVRWATAAFTDAAAASTPGTLLAPGVRAGALEPARARSWGSWSSA